MIFNSGGPKKAAPSNTPPEGAPISDPILLAARYQKILPDIDANRRQKIVNFHVEVLRIQKYFALVPQSSLRNLEILHFLDSVIASRILEKQIGPDVALLDLGSGSGFPGVVFSILFPERSVVVMDRDRRKIDFLRNLTRNMSLPKLSFEVVATEELVGRGLDNVVVRSEAALTKTMLNMRKVVKLGGKVFHLKGDSWAVELGQVPSQLFSFWSPSLVAHYKLPETPMEMGVVLTTKTAE